MKSSHIFPKKSRLTALVSAVFPKQLFCFGALPWCRGRPWGFHKLKQGGHRVISTTQKIGDWNKRKQTNKNETGFLCVFAEKSRSGGSNQLINPSVVSLVCILAPRPINTCMKRTKSCTTSRLTKNNIEKGVRFHCVYSNALCEYWCRRKIFIHHMHQKQNSFVKLKL